MAQTHLTTVRSPGQIWFPETYGRQPLQHQFGQHFVALCPCRHVVQGCNKATAKIAVFSRAPKRLCLRRRLVQDSYGAIVILASRVNCAGGQQRMNSTGSLRREAVASGADVVHVRAPAYRIGIAQAVGEGNVSPRHQRARCWLCTAKSENKRGVGSEEHAPNTRPASRPR